VRVLLDTNVLAVGMAGHALGWKSHSALIWHRLQAKEFDILVSIGLLTELEQTWSSTWVRDHLSPERMSRLSALLLSQAILVEVTHEVHGVASHWQDDLVLAAAVSGSADFLVTRDKEFRRVGEYRGVKIRTPAEFLIELDATVDSE
jgi:putative PIN family toxin of toxin-antitoxin system